MATMSSIALDREHFARRIADARRSTDEIFGGILVPGAIYERPIPERHRLIFYLGHVEAFDMNIIAKSGFDRPSFNDVFDSLFAFGIDPIDGGLPNEPASDWPAVHEVLAYRDRVRREVDDVVAHGDFGNAQLVHDVLNVGIEHRLEHAETLAYLLHQLPTNLKRAPVEKAFPATAPGAERVRVPAGRATLGRTRGEGFGWCNEFDAHVVDVPAFAIERNSVTNGRFLEFLRAGGYEKPKFWSAEDWAWRSARDLRHPLFWKRREDGWYLRGAFSERALPLSWPAYVSYAEASAFARWAGRTLPTEAQFHRAAYGTPDGAEREYPWGNEPPAPNHGNFDLQRWDPVPAGSFPDGDSAWGVADLVGNGYEWTSTPFAPFDGFVPYPFYPGYSANFFDGKHFVMKGGSPRTAGCMLRRSFRNWFQGHYPYVHAKFRLVGS
jgi:ergothioneine biosynthesis protein EgtB